VLCVGRICEEAHGGRLNQASVQLEGSRGHSMGSTIALDLSGLLGNDGGDVGDRGNREYGCSLFPGQIVAVEGDQSLREDHEGDARDRGRRSAAACVDRGRCTANVLVVVVSGRKLPRRSLCPLHISRSRTRRSWVVRCRCPGRLAGGAGSELCLGRFVFDVVAASPDGFDEMNERRVEETNDADGRRGLG